MKDKMLIVSVKTGLTVKIYELTKLKLIK